MASLTPFPPLIGGVKKDCVRRARGTSLLCRQNASISGAEIAFEHDLGLTRDRVSARIQISCIERSAPMRAIGRDMRSDVTEMARGGLSAVISRLTDGAGEC
jgi:L-serine deaminase